MAEQVLPKISSNKRDTLRYHEQDHLFLANEDTNEILTTIILPAYNEEAALPKVLNDLCSIIDNHYEILVVDDGSSDKTAEIAQGYDCRLIQHIVNQGKGKAVQTGLRQARGKYVVVMDADATYPASAIPKMVEMLDSCDLVRCIRQRNNESMPTINRVGNYLFDWLLVRIIGLEGNDHLSGLYAIRRKLLDEMKLESMGFDLETEINFKAKYKRHKIGTLPITYLPRLGEKKLRPFRDGGHILNRILLLILVYNPTAFFVVPGFFVLTLSFLGAIILSETPVITPYFGLDIHSFILAAMGILGGFQLMVFGISASLYAVEVGYEPQRWLVSFSAAPLRLGAAGIGFVLILFEILNIFRMVIEWLMNGAGSFMLTRELVMSATILVGGLQMLSAASFISIFAGRLKRNQIPTGERI